MINDYDNLDFYNKNVKQYIQFLVCSWNHEYFASLA